jgi:hypothetical protein
MIAFCIDDIPGTVLCTATHEVFTVESLQRLPLPTTVFSLVLRKEYFDCPQRDSLAVPEVHYI